MASVSSANVSMGTYMTVTGSGFAVKPFIQLVSLADASVTVGCDVAFFNDTHAICKVADGGSGSYELRVVVGAHCPAGVVAAAAAFF